MGIFDKMREKGHQMVIFAQDKGTGLKAIIAIHDTTLGPALGGTRIWKFESEEEALDDALRLSYGMTLKNIMAGVEFGGGKGVIIADPRKEKNELLLRAYGRVVAGLNGGFFTGTDVGMNMYDSVIIAKEAPGLLAAIPTEYGGGGDSSYYTAVGVWYGMQAVAKFLWGEKTLCGKTISIQGVGKVGSNLVRVICSNERDVKVKVADIVEERAKEVQMEFPDRVEVVPHDDIFSTEADIFAPCALGGILNDETIPKLAKAGVKAIAGSANNQLADPERHGKMLHDVGILYAPDYVINAGGVIMAADELEPNGFNKDRVMSKIKKIYYRLLEIFERAKAQNKPASKVADEIATEHLEHIRAIRRRFAKGGPRWGSRY